MENIAVIIKGNIYIEMQSRFHACTYTSNTLALYRKMTDQYNIVINKQNVLICTCTYMYCICTVYVLEHTCIYMIYLCYTRSDSMSWRHEIFESVTPVKERKIDPKSNCKFFVLPLKNFNNVHVYTCTMTVLKPGVQLFFFCLFVCLFVWLYVYMFACLGCGCGYELLSHLSKIIL